MLKFFKRRQKESASLIDKGREHHTPKFHQLKISDVRRETADCVSIAFELPEDLVDDYHFKAGQNLTLRTVMGGEEIRRSYSICSCPEEGELRVAVKRVEGGVFSSFANKELQAGMNLDVMTPTGGFTIPFDENRATHYVAIAAGSGITPIISLIKSALNTEPESRFTLIYANRNSASIIFKDEIEDLKDAHMNRLEVHHVLSREDQGSDMLKGRIDEEKVKAFADRFFEVDEVEAYFLCGPEAIIRASERALASLGVDPKKIHFELFTPATPVATKVKTEKSAGTGDVMRSVTVILDGDETHMEIGTRGKTILDSALDAGADVPFACKGAVCCTCRARVLEGTVDMEMNYSLTDEEIDEGYVLTCQSHPTSDRVVVSYDE